MATEPKCLQSLPAFLPESQFLMEQAGFAAVEVFPFYCDLMRSS